MVWEEVAGEGAKVPKAGAVDPIKSMEILDSWWSGRSWLGRVLKVVTVELWAV